MAVQYINGKLYDIWQPSMASNVLPPTDYSRIPGVGILGKEIGASSAVSPAPTNTGGMGSNPFASASSGGVRGTLQPYINRMTQNASNALYGGLLGYSPQSLVAGNAGGTPQNSAVPQWRLPSAIPTPNQGQVGLLGAQANNQQLPQGIFGQRSWMTA